MCPLILLWDMTILLVLLLLSRLFVFFFFSSFPLVLISLTLTELDDQEFVLHFAINYQLLAMHIV